MPTENEISFEHISGILEIPVETASDKKSQTRALLQVFQDIKVNQVRQNGEWDPDSTFDSFPVEVLEKMSEILTKETVDNVVPQHTNLNNLGIFVVSYIADTIEAKNNN